MHTNIRMSEYPWLFCYSQSEIYPISCSWHQYCGCLMHTNCNTIHKAFKTYESILIGTDIFIFWSLITLLFHSVQEFQSVDQIMVKSLYTQS